MTTKKEKLMKKAQELCLEYEPKYHGCAQATFAAIADTLGIYNEDVFKALIGLTGGTGDMGRGTCGGLVGATAAIGLLYGANRNELTQEHVIKIGNLVAEIGQKFLKEYGSITCWDIQKKVYGRSFNLRDPKELEEFLRRDDIWKCGMVCGKAAAWAIEKILEK